MVAIMKLDGTVLHQVEDKPGQSPYSQVPEAFLEAFLSGKDMTGLDLTGANLAGLDLTGIDLSGSDMYRADLTGTNLTEANLTKVNLYRAKLVRAILTDADLTGANLAGAEFYGVTLGSTTLFGTNLNTIQDMVHMGPVNNLDIYVVRHESGLMVQAGPAWGTEKEVIQDCKEHEEPEVIRAIRTILKLVKTWKHDPDQLSSWGRE